MNSALIINTKTKYKVHSRHLQNVDKHLLISKPLLYPIPQSSKGTHTHRSMG